jgi:hypothetical protein
MGAAVASVLKLPLSAVVLATLLTSPAGTGQEPLIIVGVVVAYVLTLAVSRTPAHGSATAPDEAAASQAAEAAPVAAATAEHMS